MTSKNFNMNFEKSGQIRRFQNFAVVKVKIRILINFILKVMPFCRFWFVESKVVTCFYLRSTEHLLWISEVREDQLICFNLATVKIGILINSAIKAMPYLLLKLNCYVWWKITDCSNDPRWSHVTIIHGIVNWTKVSSSGGCSLSWHFSNLTFTTRY